MLPRLSRLSVSCVPGRRLRLRCSAGYQRISPLHPAFPFPIPHSSRAVSDALSGLSPEISHPTRLAAYAPFTPSKSEQRYGPLYYRGCWHRVSRPFLLRYHQIRDVLGLLSFSLMTGVYDPRAFTQRRIVRVSPIANDPRLQPPVGVWAVSQSQCGWPSSQTS